MEELHCWYQYKGQTKYLAFFDDEDKLLEALKLFIADGIEGIYVYESSLDIWTNVLPAPAHTPAIYGKVRYLTVDECAVPKDIRMMRLLL